MIGEAIHQAHYNNQAFTGNCFTCHATTNDGELVLFDEYIYTGELGGFPENVGSPEWQEWIALRGNVSGGDTIAGINVVNDWQLDKVELDQRTIFSRGLVLQRQRAGRKYRCCFLRVESRRWREQPSHFHA